MGILGEINILKVAILLSTYNGEKYLNDQINSIKQQVFQNWELFIRDDGSKDDTIRIIKENEKKDQRIHFLENDSKNNLGPMGSFFYLLKKVTADYYFFCDQDDFWKKDKISLMLAEFSNNNFPEMVYCNLKCVDKNLHSLDNAFEKMIGKLHGKNRFIGNDAPGCVMAINHSLKKLTLNHVKYTDNIVMHDWWMALIAEQFGNVKFLDKKLVLYRQHGDNTIGAGKSGNILKKLFQKDLFKKQCNLVKEGFLQTKTFYKDFRDQLNNEDLKFLNQFISCEKNGWMKRYVFLKRYHLKQTSKIRTIVYRTFFVFYLRKCLE